MAGKKKITVHTEECDVTVTVRGNKIHVKRKDNPGYEKAKAASLKLFPVF